MCFHQLPAFAPYFNLSIIRELICRNISSAQQSNKGFWGDNGCKNVMTMLIKVSLIDLSIIWELICKNISSAQQSNKGFRFPHFIVTLAEKTTGSQMKDINVKLSAKLWRSHLSFSHSVYIFHPKEPCGGVHTPDVISFSSKKVLWGLSGFSCLT